MLQSRSWQRRAFPYGSPEWRLNDLAMAEPFTAAVMHFKSKGCTDATGDDTDQGDGQGCYNATRSQMATVLTDWLATDPTGSGDPDFLIIGDLNAYAMEDPITQHATHEPLDRGGTWTILDEVVHSVERGLRARGPPRKGPPHSEERGE